MTLNLLDKNIEKTVVGFVKETHLVNRLITIGIYPGKKIKVVRRAPFGDPIEVEVGGVNIGLRNSIAKLILVGEI